MSTDRYHYPTPTRWLHWAMVALLAATYAFIELRVLFDKGTDPREALKAAHFMAGLTVLMVALARVAARLQVNVPPIVPALPGWQRASARTVHAVLYAWMLAMPVAGWMLLSAQGTDIGFLGFSVPPLMAPDKALAREIKEVHEIAGRAGYFVIGLHVLAALWHHFVRRDDTLLRMLPVRSHQP